MAVEKVGVYRKWLEPVPKTNGKPIPKSRWPKKRRHCWSEDLVSATKLLNSILAKTQDD